ncbi:protein of unknown function [Nitrosotalea devaniterrae]|uniref:DEAD/DEAH box helicase n=1 Tax=Nitrosotalea devaniterrae TaxID=1078905 RepID=A0A128A1V9_9ARCH|nr:protein of unknown function [Candidatus Nitrosotalea devanaterra]
MSESIIQELCDEIYADTNFRSDYTWLLSSELKSHNHETELSGARIKKLAESAAILALSKISDHQKIAFKVAIFLMNQFGKKIANIQFLTELVLCRLGDLPTIEQIISEKKGRDYFSFTNSKDSSVFLELKFPEIFAKKFLNQFEIFDKNKNFTDFQSDVFRSLMKGKNVAYSAPTSAGKSFIIHNYAIYKILTAETYTVLFIVPTRALIDDVHRSLIKILEFTNQNDVQIVSSVNDINIEYLEKAKRKILIFTQERLQYIQSRGYNMKIDLVVIDEAQKIKDAERGVILEDSVSELLLQNPTTQIVCISPYMKSLENFKDIFSIKEIEVLPSSRSPVGRNVFFINFIEKRKVDVSIFSEELKSTINIETIELEENLPTTQYETKAWIAAKLLSGRGHTIVYCTKPTECKNVSEAIANEKKEFQISSEISETIEFLKKNVHSDYDLIDYLSHGIGYHYGKMPNFVRFLIQRLFEKKTIDYLCCTSTLLEGVNLPAKNIVLYKPKKGSQNEMDRFTIKNLAGRAGRLGKDYYGNIYCVDIEEWKEGKDAFKDELEDVQSSTELTLTIDAELLVSHLEEYQGLKHGKKNVLGVATSLIINQIRDPEQHFLSNLETKYPEISPIRINQIGKILQDISLKLAILDKKTILRNKSIDPRLQLQLYLYLKNRYRPPVIPEPGDIQISAKLHGVFELIYKFLLTPDQRKNSIIDCTHIAGDWINQKYYKQILESRIYYEEKHRKKSTLTKKEINKLIDKVDDILENDLRFSYTRGLQCYSDILELVIRENKLELKSYSNLADHLEIGAYDKRVYFLMNLGFSRNNAISITKIIPKHIENINECKQWLKANTEKIQEIFKDKTDRFWRDEFDSLLSEIQK